MSIAYIRKAYGVDFKVGERLQIKPDAGGRLAGRTGKVTGTRNHYLRVKGENWEGLFHPTSLQRPAP